MTKYFDEKVNTFIHPDTLKPLRNQNPRNCLFVLTTKLPIIIFQRKHTQNKWCSGALTNRCLLCQQSMNTNLLTFIRILLLNTYWLRYSFELSLINWKTFCVSKIPTKKPASIYIFEHLFISEAKFAWWNSNWVFRMDMIDFFIDAPLFTCIESSSNPSVLRSLTILMIWLMFFAVLSIYRNRLLFLGSSWYIKELKSV